MAGLSENLADGRAPVSWHTRQCSTRLWHMRACFLSSGASWATHASQGWARALGILCTTQPLCLASSGHLGRQPRRQTGLKDPKFTGLCSTERWVACTCHRIRTPAPACKFAFSWTTVTKPHTRCEPVVFCRIACVTIPTRCVCEMILCGCTVDVNGAREC